MWENPFGRKKSTTNRKRLYYQYVKYNKVESVDFLSLYRTIVPDVPKPHSDNNIRHSMTVITILTHSVYIFVSNIKMIGRFILATIVMA